MNYFITGTDTDCGKTYVTALLVRAGRATGMDIIGAKPFCCGPRDDVEILAAASGDVEPLDALNPVWLKNSAAPLACTLLGEKHGDVAPVLARIRALASRHTSVLCEGAGGWLVPVAENYTMADFAVALGWPVIVVARNQLGVLNHTLLTIESIRSKGLQVAGVILNNIEKVNSPAQQTNRLILEKMMQCPLLFEIHPHTTHLSVPEKLFS